MCATVEISEPGSGRGRDVEVDGGKEFAIPGAPTDTIDVKILEDSVHLTAPARDIEYLSALALGWPVKHHKAEATYENGLLRIEVPFKDPMEDAVKVAIKTGVVETKTKRLKT